MAVQKLRFENSDQWAVWHSTSDTLFSPMFHDELAAQIFAVYYGRGNAGRRVQMDYSTETQERIARAIGLFLDTEFPEKEGSRIIPIDKCARLNPAPDYYDDDERAEWDSSCYSVDELISALDEDYDGEQADLIMEWLKPYLQPAAVTTAGDRHAQ